MERESTTRRNIFCNRGWFSPQLKRKDISDNVNEWRRVRACGKQNPDDYGCQTMEIENVTKDETIKKRFDDQCSTSPSCWIDGGAKNPEEERKGMEILEDAQKCTMKNSSYNRRALFQKNDMKNQKSNRRNGNDY